MHKIAAMMPLAFMPGGRAKDVSLAARASNVLFGAPNARRANGIVFSGLDVAGATKALVSKITGTKSSAPVFSIDRIGCVSAESLPRVWLSEKVSNTSSDDGRRVFVESYPSGPDRGGARALELGDRYLGEGSNCGNLLEEEERIECFKAAEILYMHAARRGSRTALSRLSSMYRNDLCNGDYWKTYLESRARHAKRRAPERSAPQGGYDRPAATGRGSGSGPSRR